MAAEPDRFHNLLLTKYTLPQVARSMRFLEVFMEHRSYQKAPVVEAVIEVLLASPLSKSELDDLAKRLKKTLPQSMDQSKFAVAFSPVGVNINRSPYGYRLSSNDDLKIALLRPEGVTTSVLAPYSGWDELRSHAEKVLEATAKTVGRRPIRRLGVRYINRLDIPSRDLDLRDWINLQIEIPSELGRVLTEFGARVVVPNEEAKYTTILSFGTAASPLVDYSSLMLDVDVFTEHDVPSDKDEFWVLAERLRAAKNRVFESCITDRMRAQFGQDTRS